MPAILFAIALALLARARGESVKKFSFIAPCYVVHTAIVADASPTRVKRIVTTGVRRATGAASSTPPSCDPADAARIAQLRLAATDQLGADAPRAAWIHVASPDSTVAGDHLTRLAHLLAHDSLLTIVHIGRDDDLLPVARTP